MGVATATAAKAATKRDLSPMFSGWFCEVEKSKIPSRYRYSTKLPPCLSTKSQDFMDRSESPVPQKLGASWLVYGKQHGLTGRSEAAVNTPDRYRVFGV